MDVSDWTYEGAPNYPLKVTRREGQSVVTSSRLKDREWVGATEEQALRAFRHDTQAQYDQEVLGKEPAWMTEERAKKAAD